MQRPGGALWRGERHRRRAAPDRQDHRLGHGRRHGSRGKQRSFQCDFGTKITGFTLRPIAPQPLSLAALRAARYPPLHVRNPEQVRHIAKLARIAMSDAEIDALVPELNNILGWVEQLGEVEHRRGRAADRGDRPEAAPARRRRQRRQCPRRDPRQRARGAARLLRGAEGDRMMSRSSLVIRRESGNPSVCLSASHTRSGVPAFAGMTKYDDRAHLQDHRRAARRVPRAASSRRARSPRASTPRSRRRSCSTLIRSRRPTMRSPRPTRRTQARLGDELKPLVRHSARHQGPVRHRGRRHHRREPTS